MSKDIAAEYYSKLHESVYGNIVSSEAFDKFWRKFERKGQLTENKTVAQEHMIKAIIEEWREESSMLQDMQITIYEVGETFPTMYFMQKIEKKLVRTISGVEQEIIQWEKRIAKHSKTRTKVKHIFNHINRPDVTYDEEGYKEFLEKVGPILKTFVFTIRHDVDTGVNGGIERSL